MQAKLGIAILIATLLLAANFQSEQSGAITANLGDKDQQGIPDREYTLIRFTNVKYNTFGADAFINSADDSYFVAPRSGIVRFSGQVVVVLDSSQPAIVQGSYVVRIFKNHHCGEIEEPALIAGYGSPSSFWWVQSVPINGEDLARKGDIYRWCVYATTTPEGTKTAYLQGDPAHTRIHVSMGP
jgi:hypothetical protein